MLNVLSLYFLIQKKYKRIFIKPLDEESLKLKNKATKGIAGTQGVCFGGYLHAQSLSAKYIETVNMVSPGQGTRVKGRLTFHCKPSFIAFVFLYCVHVFLFQKKKENQTNHNISNFQFKKEKTMKSQKVDRFGSLKTQHVNR